MATSRIIRRGPEMPVKQKIVSLDEDKTTAREWVSGAVVGVVCALMIVVGVLL